MKLREVLYWLNGILSYKLFELNQTPVSLYSIIVFVLLIILTYYISRSTNRYLLNRLLRSLEVDEGMRYTMKRISHYIIMTVGVLFAFQFVGISLSSLTVIFGLLSVGIGFGLQNIASNFISGLILLFERPISIGDHVTVGNTEGVVDSISIRSTTITTLNNITIIVPNSEFISSNVVNWSHGDPKIRLDIEIGVAYQSDTDTVVRVLKEVAAAHKQVLRKPEPEVLLSSFGDSSLNMVLRVWIANPRRHHKIRSDINFAIVNAFRRHHIEIPFPQRDVHLVQANQSNAGAES